MVFRMGFYDGIISEILRNHGDFLYLMGDINYNYTGYESVSQNAGHPNSWQLFFFRNMMWVTLNEPLGVFPNHCETHEGHPKIL